MSDVRTYGCNCCGTKAQGGEYTCVAVVSVERRGDGSVEFVGRARPNHPPMMHTFSEQGARALHAHLGELLGLKG